MGKEAFDVRGGRRRQNSACLVYCLTYPDADVIRPDIIERLFYGCHKITDSLSDEYEVTDSPANTANGDRFAAGGAGAEDGNDSRGGGGDAGGDRHIGKREPRMGGAVLAKKRSTPGIRR
jgi:hypothetical protein